MRLTGSTIRLHLAATTPSDGLSAVKVTPFFQPKLLRGVGVTGAELCEELGDVKFAMEEKRVHLLGVRYATPLVPCPARPYAHVHSAHEPPLTAACLPMSHRFPRRAFQ